VSDVIFFEGTKKRDDVSFLVFRVGRGLQERHVEVPVDERVAQHIMVHLDRAAPPPPKLVERGNDEESL